MMERVWFTPAELAALNLPDLPETVSGLIRQIKREAWADRLNLAGAPLARRRQGRGGGWEYHYTLLPQRAQAELIHRFARQAAPAADAEPAQRRDSAALWEDYDRLGANAKARAAFRLTVLTEIEALTLGGMEKNSAVHDIVSKWRRDGAKIGKSAVWEWYGLVAGLDRHDWQAALAPRHRGRTVTAECCPAAWESFKADYLRPSQPTATSCYERLFRIREQEGFGAIPPLKTLLRRMENEVDRRIVVLCREGKERLRQIAMPPLERDHAYFHALEAVNADGHEWDFTCVWPDGYEGRPKTVVFQDIRTGKLLSARTSKTENTDIVRLAYADVVERFGIPNHAYLDNGRGFASKWMTGGTEFRFRGKITADEQLGIFNSLGTDVHFTIPRRGQSKPIERAFGGLQDHVSRRAEFDGAYTGNSPMNKPANYGTKVVPIQLALEIIQEEIAAHNARLGRRSAVCAGRSFDQAWTESYDQAVRDGLIRRASEAQKRMLLLPAERVKANRDSGFLTLYGNRFWAEFLVQHAGDPLIVRFDPQRVQAGAHVYRMNNSYLGFAACMEKSGFGNTEDARTQERERRRHIKLTKERAKLEVRMSQGDLMRAHEAARRAAKPPVEETPDTNVIRAHFAGNAALDIDDERDSAEDAEIVNLHLRRGVALSVATE